MRKLMLAAAFALPLVSGTAIAQETVKIGYIDPLSGGGASVGEIGLKTYQFIAEELNAKGGILGKKVEIVPFDNKTNPQESLIQAQKAIDSGVRYLTQGNGSSVAGALSDFVNKYNDRNPGKEVLYFNYAAVDPVLTNDKCSFWHFRWDANSDIKMEALTNYMKDVPTIKKVYLINQDYSFGESVRTAAKAMLAAKRPDIQIVGNELHPLLKVTDFAPYIAKIKASGADTVITGNWGQDFALLLKAAADSGLKANWYTYYAGGTGGPTAIKQANLNHQVFTVTEGFANVANAPSQEFEKALRAKYDFSLFYPRAVNEMRMFALAAEKAKSLDPVKVAAVLEGMEFEVFNGGKGFMRKDDHQFFQPMYIASLGERTEKSRSTRNIPAGAGNRLPRSTRRKPCFRPLARWTGRTDRHIPAVRPDRASRLNIGTNAGGLSTIPSTPCGGAAVLELVVISTLNGVLYGMLLFLMASGLTVIFSMLGVLNFAHASFYMLGAFFGFQISRWIGFWPALLIAPPLVGAIGAAVERYGLRPVHKNGHVAELLFTFGLAFAIEEVVQIIWGKSPVDFRVPPLLDFPAFTIFSTNYPAYKMFMLLVSIVIFAGLLITLKKTRIGLIVQAALTHPHMVGHLGHNVGRIFMLVFGVGTALAAVAGVIAGPALVTQSNMAGLLGPILFVVVVVGGLGSLPGAFIASLLIGLVQTFAVSMDGSLASAFGPLGPGNKNPFVADIWNVTIAQIAPIMPYFLLVLILIVRPMGLLGKRES